MEAFITDAMAGTLKRRRFISLIKAEMTRLGKLAYRDGLIDGGVLDGVPDKSDLATIEALLAQAKAFVVGLADQVYVDEPSLSWAQTKPAMWYRGSIHPLYSAGLLSANKNGMYEFTGVPGADPCKDCQRLTGQRHRLKDWARRNLNVPFIGQATECGGYNCKHILAPTTGRARGRF